MSRVIKSIAALSLTFCATTGFADGHGLDADGEPIPLAEYTIANGGIQGDVDPDHMDDWVRFNELIPRTYHPEIVLFQPIDSEATGGIDGTVAPADDSREHWLLMLDTTGAVEPHELDRTMVHEYAHLMTLRLAQVPNLDFNCVTTLSISEGCPNEGSYLDAFADAFYSETRNGDEELDYYEEDFVTEYAATNVIEDIAESFAEWVVHPERWEGDTLADEKVWFFEEYPELVQLKEDIRENL